jgi:hypothetical protein
VRTTSTTAKKESRFDVNISYTIDGVIHGVVSGRPLDRFLLNQVDVDPHNTIFSITSPIIMTGIYSYLINTRRFAIIGNNGSSSIGIISKTIVTFIISYSSSIINEDGYDFDDYFVLIENQFYDYSIWRWCILSLISLNGSNNFNYCDGYISSRHDNYYIDSIHDYDNSLYIFTIYYNDINLNYDYNYDSDNDYISSRYDYYHIDSIHYYNIDSIEDCYIDYTNISSISVPCPVPNLDPNLISRTTSTMSYIKSHSQFGINFDIKYYYCTTSSTKYCPQFEIKFDIEYCCTTSSMEPTLTLSMYKVLYQVLIQVWIQVLYRKLLLYQVLYQVPFPVLNQP